MLRPICETAHFTKLASILPSSRNGHCVCLFPELAIRKSAHFTNWATVVNELYIFVDERWAQKEQKEPLCDATRHIYCHRHFVVFVHAVWTLVICSDIQGGPKK